MYVQYMYGDMYVNIYIYFVEQWLLLFRARWAAMWPLSIYIIIFIYLYICKYIYVCM